MTESYRIPLGLISALKREIFDMESIGYIEKSTPPYSSSIVVVQMKGGASAYVETSVS